MTTIPNRDEQHGGLGPVGVIAQSIKDTMRAGVNWPRLTPGEREALDMAAHKIARILSGSNPSDPEHWSDVAGYTHAAMRLWEQQGAGGAPAKPQPHGGRLVSSSEPPPSHMDTWRKAHNEVSELNASIVKLARQIEAYSQRLNAEQGRPWWRFWP
jgi:hypothetical protein